MILTGELLHVYGISEDLQLCFSFHCFDGEDDFSLVGVVVVFVADLLRNCSALDLCLLLSNQAEPNSHQRVDVSRLKKKKKKEIMQIK